MTIILPSLAVAFAAFCVWLTVRIVNRRERWAKRTLAVMLILSTYPLSVGPVAWLEAHNCVPQWLYDVPLYQPIQWLRDNGPDPIVEAINWYIWMWLDVHV